ncbi:hypothetical protein FOA52_013038 [Chlamydomonas sp. UWO 241]|nr:hypothetical protein FOA52_013038 [Chlamydomonas sp. UWO 241]
MSGSVLSSKLNRRFNLPRPCVAVRNLMEVAVHGHLCTKMNSMQHRRDGYPFATVVDFATDGAGMPILSLSPLAIHSRNVMENPACSLMVHMPGWTGLSDAMVTVFGELRPLSRSMDEDARELFASKRSHAFGTDLRMASTTKYFRMDKIIDIQFIGGYGTMEWITAEDYSECRPDAVVLDQPPPRTLQQLTEAFKEPVTRLLAHRLQTQVRKPIFISFDAHGVEVRVRTGPLELGTPCAVHRIPLPAPVSSVKELMAAMDGLLAPHRA